MDRAEAERICICPECPTYVDCDEPVAFCMLEEGTSKCITKPHGCICGGCPVHDQMGFLFGYYCIEGSEAAQGAR